jgi:hypothetical protein
MPLSSPGPFSRKELQGRLNKSCKFAQINCLTEGSFQSPSPLWCWAVARATSRCRRGLKPATIRLTAEAVRNLSAGSGVAHIRFGAILSFLPAPNSAPKLVPGEQMVSAANSGVPSPPIRASTANISRLASQGRFKNSAYD